MGSTSTRDKLIDAIKKENEEELLILLKINKPLVQPNEYVNESATFTALNIASSFGSIKVATLLVNNGWNVDTPEKKNMNSSLLLACKFGYLDIVKLLVNNKANLHYVNKAKLNCLDMAVVSGHYPIAHYLLSKELQLNTIDYYKGLIEVPYFNLDVFYSSLSNGVLPENAPSFALKKSSNKHIKKEDSKQKEKDKDEKPERERESKDEDKKEAEEKKANTTFEEENGTGLVLLSESKVLQDNSIKINMNNFPPQQEEP